MARNVELDAKTLSQIRNIGGDELLGRLARLFLERTPVRLKEIRRGLSKGDWSRTSLAIHSLRSSSVTLGALELAAEAAELERMATEKEREALKSALPGLEEKTQAVLAAMKTLSEGAIV